MGGLSQLLGPNIFLSDKRLIKANQAKSIKYRNTYTVGALESNTVSVALLIF
jgi:hypothetical protein